MPEGELTHANAIELKKSDLHFKAEMEDPSYLDGFVHIHRNGTKMFLYPSLYQLSSP